MSPDTTLTEALFDLGEATPGDWEARSQAIEKALRAALRAAVPGRQQVKNLAPLMAAGRVAFIRSLKRATQAAKSL